MSWTTSLTTSLQTGLAGTLAALPRSATWTVSSIATLGVASAIGLGLAYVMPGGSAAAAAAIATTAPATPPSAALWMISNDVAGTGCEVRRGPRLSGATHALDLGRGCATVSERLAEAVVWNEDRDGSISLSDATGRLVVAFAPSEGRGMEAFQPAHMMLSLARQ